MNRKDRTKIIFEKLSAIYPDVETPLKNWNNEPWKFLVCVILSAQTTDKQVNKVTEELFERFPTLQLLGRADENKVAAVIKPVGFYNVKSKYLKQTAQILIEKYNGKVPLIIDELVKLPGVGRKTANVVTGVLLDENFGIAVDTHVMRLSQRLGFTKNKTPEKIEKDLMKLFNNKDWNNISLLLIAHGRKVCFARKPRCAECVLNKICPSAFKF